MKEEEIHMVQAEKGLHMDRHLDLVLGGYNAVEKEMKMKMKMEMK
jgi:hypothetical protein